MDLRPYQFEAFERAIKWLRTMLEPSVIEAATGAGKSYIIAAVANEIHKITGKKVLCLCPSAELVQQNREKYLLTGNPASVFSASAGRKCLRHHVVFGTPGTVKNRITSFGGDFALVIIDECHELTPTIKSIIECIRDENDKLRVLGLSATPYRMKTGYIYAIDENDTSMPVDVCIDPYFKKKLITIGAHELIASGYLCPPKIGCNSDYQYDTSNLIVNNNGKFNPTDEDKAYHGHGRKTAAIIGEVVHNSQNKQGVLIFAATIQHAEEVFASLPKSISAIVTSKTSKSDRAKSILRFRNKIIKYIVNVGVFIRGFDVAHIDHVVFLRLTESASLLQQMGGRGCRQDDDKEYFLMSDYAGNIERHCPDGDFFSPKLKPVYQKKGSGLLEAACKECGMINTFSARPNPDNFDISVTGYFLDIDGKEIKTHFGSMPAHFGRRCTAWYPHGIGELTQCKYRWTFKECPHCSADNDITARYCKTCKGEIIDPNEKLQINFTKFKRDPTQVQTDNVLSMAIIETMSKAGNPCLRINFVTEYRSFSIWLHDKMKHKKNLFMSFTKQGTENPNTITYIKNKETKFYDVISYNQEIDEV